MITVRSAELPVKSVVRMKFFTIDHQLIIHKLGGQSPAAQEIALFRIAQIIVEFIAILE